MVTGSGDHEPIHEARAGRQFVNGARVDSRGANRESAGSDPRARGVRGQPSTATGRPQGGSPARRSRATLLRVPIDPIARLVLDSGGHLLTRDLPQRGVPHHHVLRDARAGRLERVDRGVYLVRDRDREPRARYADRVRAVRAAHPGWAASHHSALELHGLPRLSADHSTVHLLGPAGRSRRRPGLHLHRDPGADVVDDGTGAVVGAAVACVQVAALDGVDAGLVAMDAALARGLVEHADLEHSLAWVRYGVGAARRALELAHGRSESPGPGAYAQNFSVPCHGWEVQTDGL